MASLTNEPETFQHYQVMRRENGTLWELGRGAMGVTYKAFDTNLRAPVALKVINALHLDSETSRARFVREARAAAGLRHRNVASVYHLGHDDQSFFYAMEFVDGDTVEGMVKHQGPLKAAVALQIALQVSRALGAAAKQQLVHRDIKPANLMVVTEDEEEDQLIVKVIDFGLARPALGGEGSAHITMGGFVGTPQYASPEQLEEKELDARSDIYSLGITLWYMLAGKPPFSGPLGSVFIQQLTKDPPWDHLVGVPQPVRALLAHLLEKDPDKRPQSPVELRREIESCLKKLPSETGRISLAGSVRGDTAATVTPTTTPLTQADTRTETPVTTRPDDEGSGIVSSALTAVPSTGSILGGHYALDSLVGEGNNGRVFRARDIDHGETIIAIRILHPEVLKEPAQISRLEANLDKLRAAPHPNLLSFEALHHSGEVKFLVGEWVNGFNLVELLRARGKIGLREVLQLLVQAAAAADHAKNAQLTRLELGLHQILAHFPDAPLDEKNSAVAAKTALGLTIDRWPRFALKLDALGIFREAGDSMTWMGDMTILPARPERDRDTQTSIRGLVEDSHIFSLGSLVYELLNGSPPDHNRQDEGRDTKYVALPALNEAGNTVLRKALSPNPGFTTSTEFFRELLAASGFGEEILAPGSPAAPAVVIYRERADSEADSTKTLIFDPQAHHPAEFHTDDSSAATLVLHDESHLASSFPTVALQDPALPEKATPLVESLIVTARSVESIPSQKANEQSHGTVPPPANTDVADESDAPTLQGYSFVSRGSGLVDPPEIEPTVPHAPAAERDDNRSADDEAPTLQGYSFKTPADETKGIVAPHAESEIVHDDYGSDEVEAPTLQGYSFKAQPTDSLSIAPPAATPIVPDEYGSEDIEASTLQGFSFKAQPSTEASKIVVPPPVSLPAPDVAKLAAVDDAESYDAPTLQGYSFKAQPADAAGIIIAPPVDPVEPEEIKPASEELAGDFDAPTLQGYSFKAHQADVVVPPTAREAGHEVPLAPNDAEASSAADTPTLEGYSFSAHVSDVAAPSLDKKATEHDAGDAASKEVAPTDQNHADTSDEKSRPVDTSLQVPEPPTLDSPFLTVADATLVDTPLVATPGLAKDVSVPSSDESALHIDQADVSLDRAKSAAPPSAPSTSSTAKVGADALPGQHPSAAIPAKERTTPSADTRFVDKPLVDEHDHDSQKRPNFALIGGVAAAAVVVLVVAVFAMRGGHTQPQTVPLVTKSAIPAQEQTPAVKNTPKTLPAASTQRDPGPTPALVVQPTPASETSFPPQNAGSFVDSVMGTQTVGAGAGTASSTTEKLPKATESAPLGVSEASGKPSGISQAVSRATEKNEDKLPRASEKIDEDRPSASESSRHAAAEAKRREPAPTPRPATREREPKPPVATPERVVKRETPKPEPPKPVVKKEAPKPTPDADRPRGPAVPFMR